MKPFVHDEPCALQVAFLTGQARPRSWALSPAQRDFLARVVPDGMARKVARNFPYAPDPAAWRATPLWRASLAIAWQYWRSRGASFRAQHRPAVLAMLAAADRTILLAGSCGLELLLRLELPASAWMHVACVSYGTVARARPPCPALLVLGRHDRVARRRGPAPDHWIDGGHLDYLSDPRMTEISAAFIAQEAARVAATHAAAL